MPLRDHGAVAYGVADLAARRTHADAGFAPGGTDSRGNERKEVLAAVTANGNEPMRWEQPVQYASISDIGFRRKNNQDACAIQVCPDEESWQRLGHLFLVCDGMGGHAVGELASKIAADTIPHVFFKTRDLSVQDALRTAIENANETIHKRGTLNRSFNRMGTTCAALVLGPHGAITGHVGDSRVYRVRRGHIEQLTFDHSLQWELIRQGRLKPELADQYEAKHVITRCLGPEAAVQVDIEGPYAVEPGDCFVLCSDGLTNHVSDTEIGILARELPPQLACRAMVNLANLRGGTDNITVITVRVGKAGETDEAKRTPRRSAWLTAGLLAALTGSAALGGGLVASGRVTAGAPVLAATLVAGVLWAWRRWRRPDAPEDAGGQPASRPYRKAPARLSREFLDKLTETEIRLQQTVIDEDWKVDWAEYREANRLAFEAAEKKQWNVALRQRLRAIDILMQGAHEYRRQTTQRVRWGDAGGATRHPAAKDRSPRSAHDARAAGGTDTRSPAPEASQSTSPASSPTSRRD